MKFVVGTLLVALLVSIGGLLASLFPGYIAVYGIVIAATVFGLFCIFVGYKGGKKEYIIEGEETEK